MVGYRIGIADRLDCLDSPCHSREWSHAASTHGHGIRKVVAIRLISVKVRDKVKTYRSEIVRLSCGN